MPPTSPEFIKIHIGCGMTTIEGWINCDLHPAPNVQCVFDCQKIWPFENNSASDIYASHVLEHLAQPQTFFNEAWRVLRPTGQILLRVPYGLSNAAWSDMTHLRPWFPGCFCCLHPGYYSAIKNLQYNDITGKFWVLETLLTIPPWLARWYRWPLKKAIFRAAEFVPNVARELWVTIMKVTENVMPPGMPANLVPLGLAYTRPMKDDPTGMYVDIVRLKHPTRHVGFGSKP